MSFSLKEKICSFLLFFIYPFCSFHLFFPFVFPFCQGQMEKIRLVFVTFVLLFNGFVHCGIVTENFYSTYVPFPIPDGPNPPVTSPITIVNRPYPISSIKVFISSDHTWIGDLQYTITHTQTSKSSMIMNRPGYTGYI